MGRTSPLGAAKTLGPEGVGCLVATGDDCSFARFPLLSSLNPLPRELGIFSINPAKSYTSQYLKTRQVEKRTSNITLLLVVDGHRCWWDHSR